MVATAAATAIGASAAVMATGAAHADAPAAAAGEARAGRSETGSGLPAAFEWLAPSVRVGRNELQIARFRADRSPEDLLASMTASWPQRGSPIQRTAEGGWLIAIQADGEWVETVRIRAADGGAAGLRIRQRLAPDRGDAPAFQPEQLLPRARVVNRSEQDGNGRRITSWVLASASDPAVLLASARAEARRNGFVDAAAQTPADGPLWLRRRTEEIVVTATPAADGSVAVVHWSRKP